MPTEDDTFKRLKKPSVERMAELVRILVEGAPDWNISAEINALLAEHGWTTDEYYKALHSRYLYDSIKNIK